MTFAFSDEQLAAMFEEMANKEGFNLRAEIDRLRVRPQAAPSELTMPNTSRVAAAPTSALPSHVLRRREALETGMAVAYAHYAAESHNRGPVVKIGPPPIDVREFLPEGYDPRTDRSLQLSRAVRPGRSSGTARHKALHKHKQNLTTGKNAEEAGVIASDAAMGDATKKGSSTSSTSTPAPAQAQRAPKAPVGPKKSGTTGRRSVVNLDAAPAGADVQLEPDVSAVQEEPRPDGQNAEAGMFGNSVLPKLQRAQLFATLQPAARYMAALHKRYLRLRAVHLRAARRLQRFYRTRVAVVALLRHWSGRTWPLRFVLNIRIRRKRRAILVLAKTLYENLGNSRLAIMRRYTRRVEKCKRYMRGFLDVLHARREAVRRLWERTEQAVRKRIAVRERKLAAKLKLEQRERMLASAALGPRSAGSIHAKWLSKQAEVGAILARSELVQSAYRSSAAATNRLLVAHGMGEVGGADADADGGEVSALPDAAVAVPAVATIDFDIVDPAERGALINGAIANKRRQHIEAIDRDSAERSRARGMVGLADVRSYVKARGATHQGSLLQIGAKMTEGLHRLSTQSSWVTNGGLPRAKNGFLMLTDGDLGPSWAKVINDAVLADIAAKKALYCA
jgi:hypothetical protein